MTRAFRLVETDGSDVTLLSNAAFPPGTPLEVPLEADCLRVKVRGCKKTDEDPELPFRIVGRFQNLTRAQRDRLTRSSS